MIDFDLAFFICGKDIQGYGQLPLVSLWNSQSVSQQAICYVQDPSTHLAFDLSALGGEYLHPFC